MNRHFFKYGLISIFLIIFFSSCGVRKGLRDKPDISLFSQEEPQVSVVNDSFRFVKNNFIFKNKQQLWELYVSGDPYQIGLKTGALTQNLYQFQENVFFSRVEELIPSKFKQNLLVKILKYYNRDLYKYIPNEYKSEILGISKYSTNKFDYLGDSYHRNLYLHGAHDIGHAFQDLALVGCSSLAVWGDLSEDGKMLIGRNFDFYAGDDFAKNKLISFVRPEKGNAFMSVSWAGMIGVVSGMNENGLTVTMNASKSAIPLKAKSPISIVAREILQYANTIDEAIEIAKKKEVFVSESLMVASAIDKRAVLIEISPNNFGVFKVDNSNYLICSNHFQGDVYINDKRNESQIEGSHSKYRWEKMNQLLQKGDALNPQKIAEILRDKSGLKGKALGYGNEKALNQLLAHHAIIFKPEDRLVWVSSNPYQLGEFVAYDLNKIFNSGQEPQSLSVDSLKISKDNFLETQEYLNYEEFRKQDRDIEYKVSNKQSITQKEIDKYQSLNPEYWIVYYRIGKYYFNKKLYKQAKEQFEKAKTKEITTKTDTEEIDKYLKKIKKKWN